MTGNLSSIGYFSRFGIDEALIREALGVALGKGGDTADLFFQHRVLHMLGLEDGDVNRAFTSFTSLPTIGWSAPFTAACVMAEISNPATWPENVTSTAVNRPLWSCDAMLPRSSASLRYGRIEGSEAPVRFTALRTTPWRK